ncbi:MAG: GAF domain-containing protein [Deltaproteobacteria bacterium]|nr:GAF domain-containing protein [Deltaproteobacteria bacterium]
MSAKAMAYDELERDFRGLLDPGQGSALPFETALVSLIALLKESFPAVSWVGFYRNVEGHLWVGPYQGKLACVHLKPGQGVCGKALLERKTIIVDDVHAFDGHVACDPNARSEIVVPVYERGKLAGVLDLDSHQLAAFDAVDRKRLETILKGIEPLDERVIL